MSEVMNRANERRRAIGHEIARLQNEDELLQRIQQAEDFEWPEVVRDLLEDYRKLYGKRDS